MYMREVGVTPRTTALLSLLVARGADIDEKTSDGVTLLQEAIAVKLGNVVEALVNGGADVAVLDESQRTAMKALLALPEDSPRAGRAEEGCISTMSPEQQ